MHWCLDCEGGKIWYVVEDKGAAVVILECLRFDGDWGSSAGDADNGLVEDGDDGDESVVAAAVVGGARYGTYSTEAGCSLIG